MLVKVVGVQARVGQLLTLEEKIHIFKQRPDFVCLPEYCLLDDSVGDYHRAALRTKESLKYFERLSDELSTCLIGGTVVEPEHDQLYNCCYIFNRGLRIGRYQKRFPVAGELEKGIRPGKQNLVLDIEAARVAVAICGDVFHPEIFGELGAADVDIVFVPTTSLFRPDDSVSKKQYRDSKYFGSGAKISGSYVVKVCGVGALLGKPLQGRSLIAAPWGIVARTDFAAEGRKQILTATLDICELREFRSRLHSRHEPTAAVGSRGEIETDR